MILSIKILEDAIKVRQEHLDLLKIRERSIVQPGYYNPDTHLFILADIENFESQITELKNDIKIIYDAHRLQKIPTKLEK